MIGIIFYLIKLKQTIQQQPNSNKSDNVIIKLISFVCQPIKMLLTTKNTILNHHSFQNYIFLSLKQHILTHCSFEWL